MSSIVGESNSRRRAHRVDLPMAVEIAGRTYLARDWSVGGLSVTAPSGPPAKKGEVLSARLVIPMREAFLTLPVELRLVACDQEVARFTFVELSPRNRRILRQYIELGIDGRLDNVEDMVSLLAQPELPSPIRDALVLSDAEQEELGCVFRRRATLSLIFGVLFILGLAATLFYNTSYRVEALGVALGTVRTVSAGVAGVITEMRLREGEPVEKGDALFRLDDRELAIELARLDREIALLDERLRSVSGKPAWIAGRATGGPGEPAAFDGRRLKAGLLPVPLELLRRLAEAPSIGIDVASENEAGAADPGESALLALARERIRLGAARERTALRLAARRVKAPVSGRVFRIARRPGDYVGPDEPVLLLATDGAPLIVARLRQEDTLDLNPGMEAVVAVPASGESFRARIRSIGATPVKADFTPTMEVSLGETLITLEPLDPDIRLEPFTRVSVWIRTFDFDFPS